MTAQGLRLWLRLWLSAAVASAVALAVVALAVASNEVLTVQGFSSVPRRVVSCGVSSSRLLWRLVESSLVVSRPSVVVLFVEAVLSSSMSMVVDVVVDVVSSILGVMAAGLCFDIYFTC